MGFTDERIYLLFTYLLTYLLTIRGLPRRSTRGTPFLNHSSYFRRCTYTTRHGDETRLGCAHALTPKCATKPLVCTLLRAPPRSKSYPCRPLHPTSPQPLTPRRAGRAPPDAARTTCLCCSCGLDHRNRLAPALLPLPPEAAPGAETLSTRSSTVCHARPA